MQLTNFSFLNSRNDYLQSIAKRKIAADRIETGKRLEQTYKDLGAVSQAAKQKIELFNDRASINNLKNLRSFLYAQEVSLHRVYEMYDKIEQIAIKAANPTTPEQERRDLQLEFEDYQKQLDVIMASRYNGDLLFSTTEQCGGSVEVELNELDLVNGTAKGGAGHAVRAQTVLTGSPRGSVSFRVNSGVAGDTYRVWMGDHCIFSAGPSFLGGDHTKNYNDNGPVDFTYTNSAGNQVKVETEDVNFAYPGNGWRTSSSAGRQDDDLFTITFGPGEETTYQVTPGATNDNRDDFDGNENTGGITPDANGDGNPDGDGISDYNPYDPTTGKYTNIITKNLPKDFDRTEMTIQVESTSIGKIYSAGDSAGVQETLDANGDPVDGIQNTGVEFTPLPFIRAIHVDTHDNFIYLDPKGFETLDAGQSIALPELAQEVVDMMRGNHSATSGMHHFGEMKCLLENRLGILGSEYQRVDQEIEELEDQLVAGEAAYGRIADADMAAEATEFAKQSIKSDLAAQVMVNSSRLKDVLIPLTTEHFRSSVLSAGI